MKHHLESGESHIDAKSKYDSDEEQDEIKIVSCELTLFSVFPNGRKPCF